MARTTTKYSFKAALGTLPRGDPLTPELLAANGVDGKQASYLARHGWLVRLGRGAYMLPGDPLTGEGCLAFLSSRVAGLHVAGKTALAWRGVRHNLTTVEVVELWGDASAVIPRWLSARFQCHYQTTQIFDAALPQGLGLAPLPDGRPEVLVSTPERALLEMLSDLGKTQTWDETRNLVETVRNLREPLMAELVAHLTRIKVARLATQFAEEMSAPWLSVASLASKRLGGGARWTAKTKTGEVLSLKRQ